MVRIEEAAEKLGVSVATIESWAEKGLVDVQTHIVEPSLGKMGYVGGQRLVDEEQLEAVAETMGWLQLSEEAWDAAED